MFNTYKRVYGIKKTKNVLDKLPPIATFIPKLAFSSSKEGYEEAQEYVTGKRYVNNTLSDNDSFIATTIDGYAAGFTGLSIALGAHTDERYIDRNDLNKNIKAGIIGGLIQGGLMSVPGLY